MTKLLVLLLAFSLACGGGGKGSSGTPATNPLAGPWVGTFQSATQSVIVWAMVLPDGTLRFMGSDGSQGEGGLKGSASFTAGGTFYPSNVASGAAFSLTGTGIPGVSMSGSYREGLDTGTFNLSVDGLAAPVVLANEIGNYNVGFTSSKPSTSFPGSFTLRPDGTFQGNDGSGSFTGTLAPISGSNAFNVSMNYTVTGSTSSVGYSGLAYFEPGRPVNLFIMASSASGQFSGEFFLVS